MLSLASAAVEAVPVQAVGWSPAAMMGALQNALILLFGGGGLGILVRAGVQLKNIANARAAQEDARDAARWTELMGYNATLTQRVEKLEGELRDERKRCDDEVAEARRAHLSEIADLRKEHALEVRMLNEKFDGLQRMMIQNQLSTAQALSVPANAPRSLEAADRIGVHLRAANGGEE